jgi:hypothetical protein
VESGLEDEAMNNWVKDHCVKHGPHAPGECPQCDELAEARSIVATTYIPPAPPSSNPSNEVAQLVKRLRARRDVTDHSRKLTSEPMRILSKTVPSRWHEDIALARSLVDEAGIKYREVGLK